MLRALARREVQFIVVGGIAAAAHGLARATYDLDVVYAREAANLDRLVADSLEAPLFGVPCRYLGLEKLILVKRAAGRPKDLQAIAELEALKEERDRE